MSFDTCPHHTSSFLSQEGIFCKLCEAFRQLAALSHRPHSVLSSAIEKLSKWAIRSSSVDGLPDEILIEIFQRYLEMGERTYPVDKPSSVTAFCHIDSSPVLLSHVCRVWRQIVRTTPMLWASIAIHNPRHKHIPLVKLWMNLAGSCPLSISISHGSDTTSKQQTAINSILPTLINQSHLWKSIDLEFWDITVEIDIPLGSLVALEHASVNMTDGTPDDNDTVWNLIHSSPRLSSVVWFDGFNSFKTAPWKQLKAIEYKLSVPISELLDSFQSCQNLEVLVMNSGISDTDPDQSMLVPRTITLPRLKTLEFGDYENVFHKFIDHIKAPMLTTLSLFSINPNQMSAFKNFTSDSKCILDSFNLVSCDMQVAQLLEWLETPELSSLKDVNIVIETDIGLYNPQLIVKPNRTYLETVVEKVKEFIG